MTTQEAFRQLVNNPYLWKKTSLTSASRRSYKHRLDKDEWPSLDKMEKLLESAGSFTVVQEKKWALK
ncbi:hypothetical protein GCM10027275_24920 [Rhabdobacter roseus]|uniref:Uncharacterized protein n=1 Tax=Rhabdobacter roseus TaxID=1655419 RepID=A0A840TS89_9BACT|nr:hypothetical protein [Rhabdobacter roseus]MBB5284432.1 hypothetical protein [Rhabdobacter roseus]